MEDNAYKKMAEIEASHWWFHGRRNILHSVLKSLLLPSSTKILEIGCGTGGNLKMLSTFGNVSAMDMNQYAIDIAKNKTIAINTIKKGRCPEDIPFKEKSFDLICLLDVLEHIDNDKETLIELENLLKPNGKIIVTVPAYQWMYGNHDKFLHHKRRYSKSNLINIIQLSKLNLNRFTYLNTLLLPVAIIVRLKEKLLKKSKIIGNDIPTSIANKILYKIFSFEKYIIKYFNLPFGLSILCILSNNNNEID